MFVLRTPEEHRKMCDHLEVAEDATYHSTTYGINRRTPLNYLQFYNVCDLGLPPDVMHDLLYRGICPVQDKADAKAFYPRESSVYPG